MMTRRTLLVMGSAALASCTSQPRPKLASRSVPTIDSTYSLMYAALDDEPFPVPAVDLTKVDPKFWRREMEYSTQEQPGTIVVDIGTRHAYLVLPDQRAIRYGVGVGREEAFNFQGDAVIGRKAEWPHWTPTTDMIHRDPDRYTRYALGLPGGTGNPLGARALYLYRNGEDSLYRLHGTFEPWTIGTMVSSGCVRFLNQDIIDLYRRVPNGSRVVVLQPDRTAGSSGASGT